MPERENGHKNPGKAGKNLGKCEFFLGRLDRRASVEYDIHGSKFDQSERPAGRGTPGGTVWEVAMRRSYLGGVHPASYKESTRRKPIVPLEEAPKQVVIPLTMCSGGGAVRLSGPGTR